MDERESSHGTPTGRGLRWSAVVLAAATGIIHVYVGITRNQVSLLLAGLGFFGGIGLFLGEYRPRALALAGIGYVAIQIALWLVFQAGEYTIVGMVDKTIQVGLIAVLATLYRLAW